MSVTLSHARLMQKRLMLGCNCSAACHGPHGMLDYSSSASNSSGDRGAPVANTSTSALLGLLLSARCPGRVALLRLLTLLRLDEGDAFGSWSDILGDLVDEVLCPHAPL